VRSPPLSRLPEAEADAAISWRDHVVAGRLSEALAAQLEAAPDDIGTARALNDLLTLRAHLRAKAWLRAERLATTLAPDFATVLPTLESEVTRLKESGERLERGEVDAALTLLEGVELPLLRAEVETQRGTAHAFSGDAEAAEAAFRRATEYDPKHYRAVTNLGSVALEAGRVDDAIALYQAALAINENFANAHHNLGVAYRRKGQVNKSVQAIRKAQRVGRQRERDEAKASVRGLVTGRGGRYVKWLLWAVAAGVLYLILQALGVI